MKGELAKVAAGAHGEDVDLGGHSHNYVDEWTACRAHRRFAGKALGRVDFIVDRKAHRVLETDARNLDVDRTPSGRRGHGELRRFALQALKPVAERALTDARRDAARPSCQSKIGDWSEAMRRHASADFAFRIPADCAPISTPVRSR